jgi:hypothetical protein
MNRPAHENPDRVEPGAGGISPETPAQSSAVAEDTEFRQRLRELQWRLPLPVQSILLRLLGGQYDPYSAWNREKRAIFVHVPRTAGTSLARVAATSRRHIPIARYAASDRAAFRDYFKFAFVRNPWDRLLSAFSIMNEAKTDPKWHRGRLWSLSHLRDFNDFETFVLALEAPKVRRSIMAYWHFRPQLDWLRLPRSSDVCMNFVGHFETLDEDFPRVAKRLDVQEPLPVLNSSDHPPYHDAYSSKMRRIVEELYGADIRAFDYSF